MRWQLEKIGNVFKKGRDRDMKKNVKVLIESSVLSEIGMKTFEELVKYLKYIKKKHPDNYNFRFDLDYGYEYTDLEIHADRMETDREYDKRIEREKTNKVYCKKKRATDKIKKEQEERKLLDKLQKKYDQNI